MTFYFCGLPPQNSQPQSNHEKNIRQISIEGNSTKYLTSTLQTVNIIRNKEILKNCHSQEKPKETQQRKVMWYPGWDP